MNKYALDFHTISKRNSTKENYYKKNIYKGYSGNEVYQLENRKPYNQLTSLISCRRTERDFIYSEIEFSDLSDILYYSYGITGKLAETYEARSVPSAGARYPLEIYVGICNCNKLKMGIYHFNVKNNTLELIRSFPDINMLYKMLERQEFVKQSSAMIFITAHFDRTMDKYGERGYRYILFDAGHFAQNITLISQSLNYKSVLMGGFEDDELNSVLNIDGINEGVIYVIAISK